jgi:hypothetical protein
MTGTIMSDGRPAPAGVLAGCLSRRGNLVARLRLRLAPRAKVAHHRPPALPEAAERLAHDARRPAPGGRRAAAAVENREEQCISRIIL